MTTTIPDSELAQYDYELPRALIAQQPLPARADARLMVVHRSSGEIWHNHVRDLPEILKPGDCLVVNDTRVIPARLVGYKKQTRGRWEGLFLSRAEEGHWLLLCKARGKLSPGELIQLVNRHLQEDVSLRLLARLRGGVWAARPESGEDPLTVLERVGRVPLPHYIRSGEMSDADVQHYQTVFARTPGSVAAPTAGLHFTPELIEKLRAQGVPTVYVTLHVGMGTFRPITADKLADHAMHSEWGCLTAEAAAELRACKERGGRVIGIGTTSVRVLETAAAATGQLQPWTGQTQLFIRPPYEFKAIDGLLTNFHLPRTTLLVLVRTFGGDALIQRVYEEAIRQQYRFYSYGDAMLVL